MGALTKVQQNNVWGLLQSLKGQMELAKPKHLTVDRCLRIAMTSIQRTPKLAECTDASLLGAVLTCTQLGLEPDAAAGKAYLIPYGKICTLVIGYRGLMDLARRSGEIRSLECRVVHENDNFSYAYGTEPHCQHVPCQVGEPGKWMAVYAVAQFRIGGFQFEVMSRTQIESVKAVAISKMRDPSDSPWIKHEEEMARKTVMRRLCKYLPCAAELSTAVILDEKAEAGIAQGIDFVDVDAESAPVEPRAEQLAKSLPGTKKRAAKPKPSPEPEVPPTTATMPSVPPPPNPTRTAPSVEPQAVDPPAPDNPVQASELNTLKACYGKLTMDAKGTFLDKFQVSMFPPGPGHVTREQFEAMFKDLNGPDEGGE